VGYRFSPAPVDGVEAAAASDAADAGSAAVPSPDAEPVVVPAAGAVS
jgi:hypothetical protein